MNERSSFGEWLKACRAALDLTQNDLAERVGCSPSTIQAFEQGRRRPSKEMARQLADKLQIPPRERGRFIRLARMGSTATVPSAARCYWRWLTITRRLLFGSLIVTLLIASLVVVNWYREWQSSCPVTWQNLSIWFRADALANYEHGRYYAANGDYRCAIAYYGRAIRYESQLVPAYYYRAQAYHNTGAYDQAIEDFAWLLQQAKTHEDRKWYLYGRGRSYFEKGNYTLAIQDFDEVATYPEMRDYGWLYFNRSRAYHAMGQYTQALEDLTRAIQYLEPRSVGLAYYARGKAHYAMGNYALVVLDLSEALEDAAIRDDGWVYYIRGRAHYRLGNYEKAIEDLTEATRHPLLQQYDMAYYTRALAYMKQGSSEHARIDFRRVLEFSDNAGLLEQAEVYLNN